MVLPKGRLRHIYWFEKLRVAGGSSRYPMTFRSTLRR